MSKFSTGAILVAVFMMVVLVLLGPIAVIWAWNVLFGSFYTVPLTWETWLAVVVIGTFIRSDVKIAKKD